ncbi:hypothetical protein Zm00014a_016351 [Zea mays]|uniref:DNA-directed RNA polymerase subunit beta n=2 Tax=Zea mays TaxID=4577 RepID=B6UHT6_MAIZE|nr:uncharacterized protein LOC100279105 [Zea mays]ACG48919.1 hypothetical protein [Zea mays]AQL08840.1 DNA-directed RNA polymerase subunit beta' [Zea mays]PWZ07378.1 hypothetical protein Zm00014a_016351 [Zea mays]|eukprot:NP_001145621.1 uncharacterized protein LOC100279105 [Zea mays]
MNGMLLHLPAGASTVARAPVPPLPRQLAPRRTARCSAKKKAANEAKDDRRAGDGAGVLSRTVMLRAGVALFALGFVDAGYSGDWSRIGAISKDTEELLKLGAYAVVPLSLALIIWLPEGDSDRES